MDPMRRVTVSFLSAVHRVVDWLVYRPAVVRLFVFLPRWWNCNLVRLSTCLNARWNAEYWTDDS